MTDKKLGHTGGSDCPCELCHRTSNPIDVSTHGPDGHWDYADIARLCALRDRQAREIERLRAALADKQARIDALMLEYCPDEMTPEQLDEWAAHQVPADETPASPSRERLLDLATELARYFTSLNAVPVDRVVLRRESDLYLLLQECMPGWNFVPVAASKASEPTPQHTSDCGVWFDYPNRCTCGVAENGDAP